MPSIENSEAIALCGNDDGSVTGYMCLTDFECELGAASGGNIVYPSINDLKSRRLCVEGCGIVEVQVHAVKVIQRPREIEDAVD